MRETGLAFATAALASHCALAVEKFPPRESHRPSVRSSLVIRILRCDSKSVTRREFIGRARNYAQKTGQTFRFDPAHGKGSHGRLYVGSRFTTVQRGELTKGVVAALLRQLNIDRREF